MNTESGAATPPSRLKMQSNYRAENASVKAYAAGRWPEILIAHGIAERFLSGKHSPCPIHGGKDGFRFTDEGKGYWVCATCTAGKFKDGFTLIALRNGINNKEAFKRVAQYLNLGGNSSLQENNAKQLSPPIKQPHNQQTTKLEEKQKLLIKKKAAATHANNILSKCIEHSHPYLQNKNLNQHVFVSTRNYEIFYEKLNPRTGEIENKKQTIYANALIIPIYDIEDHVQLIGAQFINADGSRAYISGTPIAEGIHIIKGDDNLPYVGVVEGYATGLSVFMATGATVIVVFDANGIKSKAERLRTPFSGKQQLAFFADHDLNNVGQKAVHAAAINTHGLVITPPKIGQDWNDYHQVHGLDATKVEIDKQLALEAQKVIKELNMSVVRDNVINLTAKLKLSYDLVPRGDFPYLSAKDNPINHPENIECLLNYYKIEVRFNLVSKRVEITIPDKKYSKTNEGEVKLADIAALCVKNGVPKADLERWILLIADKNRFSPAVAWINSKQWDGSSRINNFINTVVADNPELAKILIYRWMLGAVAAAFSEDGVSLHGVLVFQGTQGVGKTAWFKSLVPPTHHTLIVDGVTLDPRNKDSIISCTSHWLVELGELDGTFNRSDLAALKAFITKSIDYYRVPYARTESTASRNTAFFGSVNNAQYLVDETGNRRWWSISVKEINYNHGIDMQQVWAEFKYLLDQGESYYLNAEESKLVTAENALFETIDPMEEKIRNRFKWDESCNQRLTATEVLEFIGFDLTKGDRKRLGKECGAILTKMTGNKAKKSNGKMVFDLPSLKNENNSQGYYYSSR